MERHAYKGKHIINELKPKIKIQNTSLLNNLSTSVAFVTFFLDIFRVSAILYRKKNVKKYK
ncbi:hypothetical protein HanRHA438_Chr09g0397041 [Helianthus annuus]|nr:hypothetical protein HanRHA438_Chr09g0397041 [Helianthus annuus]